MTEEGIIAALGTIINNSISNSAKSSEYVRKEDYSFSQSVLLGIVGAVIFTSIPILMVKTNSPYNNQIYNQDPNQVITNKMRERNLEKNPLGFYEKPN